MTTPSRSTMPTRFPSTALLLALLLPVAALHGQAVAELTPNPRITVTVTKPGKTIVAGGGNDALLGQDWLQRRERWYDRAG